jgi:formate-dependent phosphoribosylglycinamide formyltransferase (GAR transformylase)
LAAVDPHPLAEMVERVTLPYFLALPLPVVVVVAVHPQSVLLEVPVVEVDADSMLEEAQVHLVKDMRAVLEAMLRERIKLRVAAVAVRP